MRKALLEWHRIARIRTNYRQAVRKLKQMYRKYLKRKYFILLKEKTIKNRYFISSFHDNHFRLSRMTIKDDSDQTSEESIYYEDPAKVKEDLEKEKPKIIPSNPKPKRPPPRLGPNRLNKPERSPSDEKVSSVISELRKQIAHQFKLLEYLEKKQKNKKNV